MLAKLFLTFFEDRPASPLACLAFLSFLRRKLNEAGREMTEARLSSKKAMGSWESDDASYAILEES